MKPKNKSHAEVKVHLDSSPYSITIGNGVLKTLGSRVKKNFPSNQLIVLTDKTVYGLYFKKVKRHFDKTLKVHWIVIPSGEKHKNLETVKKIYHQLIQLKADRKTGLIALGGGVVGDIGGFVAATFLRGIPYMQIPTTLLAQVDSSVGGKTGVDLKLGKNLVGAFYQPQWVLIDTEFLKTLPRREYLCGLSEIVKYGILWDARFFQFIEKNVGKILSLDHNTLKRLIHRSCEIKAHIVSKDEKEAGLRSLLNFGHTVGHAIETLSGYNKIRHGEAVSRGMVYAARLSEKRGLCSKKDVLKIEGVLEKLKLPTTIPAYSKSAYGKIIAADKKSQGSHVRFIGVKKIGKAVIVPLSLLEITRNLP